MLRAAFALFLLSSCLDEEPVPDSCGPSPTVGVVAAFPGDGSVVMTLPGYINILRYRHQVDAWAGCVDRTYGR